MTIEQERLEVIRRALTRIEDAALIRRVHQLVAAYSSSEGSDDGMMGQTSEYTTEQLSATDTSTNRPSIDLGKYAGGLPEKVDLDKLKVRQRPQRLDVETFSKMANTLEWEHTIEEMLAMIRK